MPTPTSTPTPIPTPLVSGTPVMPIPTPTVPLEPVPTPAFSATPLPLPVYTGDCEATTGDDLAIIDSTFLTGKVVDGQNKGVEGVRIRVRSLTPCLAYGVETLTHQQGAFTLVNVPANHPLEIEVSYAHQPSAFYQTRLRSNKTGDPQTNYFPFKIKSQQAFDCIALAPSLAEVSGKISWSQTPIPVGSEALVRLKSLDGCNPFDETVMTKNQAYFMNVWTFGSLGQLTVSFAGRPTELRTVPISSHRQTSSPNVHDVSLSSPQVWPELNPVWTPGSLYPGTTHLE